MAKKHSLTEYKFAMEVVKELPIAISRLNTSVEALLPFRKYAAIQSVLDSIDLSLDSLHRNLKHYTKVVELRGAKDDRR